MRGLRSVQSLEVLYRCGFRIEEYRTFRTVTVLFSTLMRFEGFSPRKGPFASVTCGSQGFA